MSKYDPNDFIALYPGVYIEKEETLVEKHPADNKAIQNRGDIDVQALIEDRLPEDTPGLGPSFTVTEAMVRNSNKKYDPENPVLNDAEQADTVVTALPLRPNTILTKSFESSAPAVYAIGDCREPHLPVEAIADGSRVARAI